MRGRKISMILLAVWMLLYGLLAITNLQFEMQRFIMGLLALAIGIALLVDY